MAIRVLARSEGGRDRRMERRRESMDGAAEELGQESPALARN